MTMAAQALIGVDVDSGSASRREAALPPVPDPGDVVEVRGSTWAVADVWQQGLPRSPADASRAGNRHVVTLQSLEEDRLGVELLVVWELKVGYTVAPDEGLPETVKANTFDDPHTWAAFVDAVRWRAMPSPRFGDDPVSGSIIATCRRSRLAM